MAPSMTTPAAVGTRLPLDPGTLVDHSWLVLDGVLFCVAGSAHTAAAVAGCAYWIRADLAATLAGIARSAQAPAGRPLTFRGATYWKLPTLANPTDWPTVHNRLSDRGITALPWSLLAACDPAAALDTIEPRAAARTTASRPGPTGNILRELLAALGDPVAGAGPIGLTGSAALDPERLRDGSDVDLLTYPNLADETLAAAIRSLGGVYLADLKPEDPRRRTFDASRFLPARPGPAAHRNRLWSRRRDVVWIGYTRLDSRPSPPPAGSSTASRSLVPTSAPSPLPSKSLPSRPATPFTSPEPPPTAMS